MELSIQRIHEKKKGGKRNNVLYSTSCLDAVAVLDLSLLESSVSTKVHRLIVGDGLELAQLLGDVSFLVVLSVDLPKNCEKEIANKKKE